MLRVFLFWNCYLVLASPIASANFSFLGIFIFLNHSSSCSNFFIHHRYLYLFFFFFLDLSLFPFSGISRNSFVHSSHCFLSPSSHVRANRVFLFVRKFPKFEKNIKKSYSLINVSVTFRLNFYAELFLRNITIKISTMSRKLYNRIKSSIF